MKIKNVYISSPLIILASLLVLSFSVFVSAQEKSSGVGNIFLDSDQDGLSDEEEKTYSTNPNNSDSDGDGYSDGTEVKTGYDPAKPAPGDKLTNSDTVSSPASSFANTSLDDDSDEDNLTNKVAQKISDVASDPGDNGITLEKVKDLVDEALNSDTSDQQLPEISKDDIKIKEQNYGNLSDKKAKEKRKEDLEDYLIAIYYILYSNSPRPLTSSSDMAGIITEFSSMAISAVADRNSSELEAISQSGEKMLEQIKEVEVPEELVDMHMQALSFAYYAKEIKNNLDPKSDDPLSDIVRMAKVQNFLTIISNFASQIEAKFVEYDLDYDEDMQKRLKNFNLFAPEREDEDKLKEDLNLTDESD